LRLIIAMFNHRYIPPATFCSLFAPPPGSAPVEPVESPVTTLETADGPMGHPPLLPFLPVALDRGWICCEAGTRAAIGKSPVRVDSMYCINSYGRCKSPRPLHGIWLRKPLTPANGGIHRSSLLSVAVVLDFPIDRECGGRRESRGWAGMALLS